VRDLREDRPDDPPRHLCPLVEHAPQSLEGALVFDLISSGQCFSLGLAGVNGLNTIEALTRLRGLSPRMPDWLALDLLDHAEQGVLKGVAAARENRTDDDGA
jgi:hypothetical protein